MVDQNKMKTSEKNKILNSVIFSKICVGSSISHIDPTHFFSLLGHRKDLFSLANPNLIQHSLKTGLLFVESLIKYKYNLVFIINIDDSTLFRKFDKICKMKNHLLLRSSEVSSGFLTNKKISNVGIITLFLDSGNMGLIQKESNLKKIPLISFNDLSANIFSSSIYICGNYTSFFSKNLILNLLSISLIQKNDSSQSKT